MSTLALRHRVHISGNVLMLSMLQLLLVYIPVHSLGGTHSFLASSITVPFGHSRSLTIKTSGSELQGQEEAASTRVFRPMRPLQ